MIFPGRVTTDARDMALLLAPPARRVPEPVSALLGFAAADAVAVLLGRATRMEGGQLALVWPAAAVGFLWLTHAWGAGRLRLHLLALTAVAALAARATGASDLLAVGLGVADAVQALVTAAVLRARQPEPGRLRSTRDLTALVLAGAVGAAASSLVGGVVLWRLDGDDLLWTVVAWIMRTCSSSLVLGAVALRLVDRRAASAVPRPTAGRGETAAGTALLVLGYGVAFAQTETLPVEFLLLPLSMWVALRVRTTAAVVHVVLVGLAVVVLTALGRGPFSPEGVALRVLFAQAFVTVVALVVLALALSADERAGLVARLRQERARSSAQAATLETVLDTVDVAIVACDAAGSVTLANRTARALQLDVAPGRPSPALFRPDGTTALPAHEVPLAQVLRDGHVWAPLLTVVPHADAAVTVSCVGRALHDEDGALLGAVVVHTDVTALRASEQEFRAAFEDGPTPMARLGEDGTVELATAALRRFLALPTRRLVGAELAGLAVPEDRERLRRAVAERSGRGPVEVRLQRADGRAVWCEVTTTVVRAPDGQAYVLVQVLDVHARKTHELALEDVAHRDALTGLDNRLVLDRRLGELLQTRDTTVVLAYLDLDGFKQVNDEHGHEAGDAVLCATGARLLALVRTGDVAVRLGGDEFVLACPVPSGAVATVFASALVERVEAALSAPVEHAGTTLHVGMSVGTDLAVTGDDAAAVLRDADLAMYTRKRARTLLGRGAPRFVPALAPPDESSRVRALRATGALDAPGTPELDDLVRAAALVAGVAAALVTLVDEHGKWCTARCGTDLGGTTREVSFCAHVVATDDELHVEDARRDPRFADDPLVTGDLAVRSCAGFPLRTPEGFVLGSLCVIGDVPGVLDEPRRAVLRLLAGRVTTLLDRTPPEDRLSLTAATVPAQRRRALSRA